MGEPAAKGTGAKAGDSGRLRRASGATGAVIDCCAGASLPSVPVATLGGWTAATTA